MSYVKIWLHCAWSTKGENCLIPSAFRPSLLRHFMENAAENTIVLDHINAHVDHVHALINLGKQQNLATVMQFVRGESSFWINNQKLLPCHFSWQDDYFALSISHSQVDRVREYITNQDKYHQNMTWKEENALLIKKYGFQRLQG